jgi:hypothetical protein
MVVALMVPMPVAAKSSKSGGKLVKSVTEYKISNDATKWIPRSKTTYTYDKKNNPKEVKELYYYNLIFDTIPLSGSVSTTTFKYKYKGKTPKSLKVMNEVGRVTESRQYKNGKVVKKFTDDTEIVKNEAGAWVDNSSHYLGAYAYSKNGLPTVASYVDTYTDNSAPDGSSESNFTFFSTQKKGIPSYMFRAYAGGKDTAKDGKVTPYTAEKSGSYETYNGKGLTVQTGYYDAETGKYTANSNIQYVMKKGKVAEAIVFEIEDGKEKPVAKYVFTYNKTSISKARYMNMVNSITHGYDDAFGPTFWY